LWPSSSRPRNHCDAVFVSLSLANGDLTAFKVQVLDAQTQHFEQPQAATAQQHRNEPLVARQVRHEARNLIHREDDGEPLGATRTNDALNSIERLHQHMLVEKEERGQRLILGGCGDVFLNGQVGQEAIDIVFAELPRVPTVVKQDGTGESSAGTPLPCAGCSAARAAPRRSGRRVGALTCRGTSPTALVGFGWRLS
jgi:hypothetical protein